MPRFDAARVHQIVSERSGLQRLLLDDGSKAYALTAVVGSAAEGDLVVVNTTAVGLDLGTGGSHVVHWIEGHDASSEEFRGRVLKARYLSEQTEVDPHVSGRSDLKGARVLLCVLHSHIGAVAVAMSAPEVGYLMTDQAALPLALSDLVAELTSAELIATTATVGQAFGGELEAVSVPSGVAALMDSGCKKVLLGAGPGHVGTSSDLGFSAMELAGHASVLNALGAEVALCVRASDVDERERHRGVSHHMTSLLKAIPVQVNVPIPLGEDSSWVTELGHYGHLVEPVDVVNALSTSGVAVRSMGKPLSHDGLACSYLGAAASWLSGTA
ncbi:MAG: DUF3866 family protein [Acidimicrobiales bacterium]|jgi:hypothetical protein|nr:DUF3866 family protein [Acidimicrobiales bacterium]MDP6901235.1 DUF3866 family protein [Acidimicrobiales bacterium]